MNSLVARRAAFRAIPRTRGYANTAAELGKTDYLQKQAALKAHAAETADLWRKISFYACIPAIAVTCLWVKNVEEEHAHHTEHLKEEHGGELPAIPDYEYMNRRTTAYPWGPNSLFFNPKVNKDMSQ